MIKTSYWNAWFAPIIVALIVLGAGMLLEGQQVLLSVALTKGMVALGLVLLMRSGLASFGQGLFYCLGAYAVGIAMNKYGMKDMVALVLWAVATSVVIAAILGLLLARYRDIFFAMLSLAFSMILYGLLVNNAELGGTDGFNVFPPVVTGIWSEGLSKTGIFIATVIVAGALLILFGWYLRTPTGRLGPAIKDNEIRVEYLGTSARRNIYINYILAAGLAGLGGALSSFSVGHIDPELTFWTTSGEFMFIAVMGGTRNAYAPFLGAIVLELLRSYAYQKAPDFWQMVMGLSMLGLIVFLPGGLISMLQRLNKKITKRSAA